MYGLEPDVISPDYAAEHGTVLELELFYDWRKAAWFWTKLPNEGMGVQGPFLDAPSAVASAEHIHPDLEWAGGIKEEFAYYMTSWRTSSWKFRHNRPKWRT